MSSTTSYATAFQTLFSWISALDEVQDVFSQLSNSAPSTGSARKSQVTIGPEDSASQVTVKGPVLFSQAPTLASLPTVAHLPDPAGGNYGGLQPDNEGKETRKQILLRRRKECKADEVDVALAPVLKLNVPYVMYPEQYKRFRNLFPRINVESGLSYTHHDHPVSHTATMVGIRKMQGMLLPGELALDLHGNPNGNEQFNRFQQSRLKKRPNLPRPPVLHTMVEHRTAADAVRRVTKWGPEFNIITKERRWKLCGLEDIEKEKYDVFLSAHTLYYYSMYEVCKLLNRNPGTRMIALVNYSPEQTGTLYGELKFSKESGMTTQVSPNGEKYHHPDIDQWFQTNSYRGLTEMVDSGISWTSTNIGGPLYIITITKCDWQQANRKLYSPPAAPTLKVAADRTFLGIVRIGGQDIRLKVSNIALASELRHFMTFRNRNDPQTFVDLVTKARRATSLDYVDGSTRYVVNDGELQDHIVYAYVADAPGELEMLEGVKLLKGDVLEPLAEALNFSGKVNKTSLMECLPFYTGIFGRSTPKATLGARTTQKGAGASYKEINSGGLLPIKRT